MVLRQLILGLGQMVSDHHHISRFITDMKTTVRTSRYNIRADEIKVCRVYANKVCRVITSARCRAQNVCRVIVCRVSNFLWPAQ